MRAPSTGSEASSVQEALPWACPGLAPWSHCHPLGFLGAIVIRWGSRPTLAEPSSLQMQMIGTRAPSDSLMSVAMPPCRTQDPSSFCEQLYEQLDTFSSGPAAAGLCAHFLPRGRKVARRESHNARRVPPSPLPPVLTGHVSSLAPY
jgi:hypothetical protein